MSLEIKLSIPSTPTAEPTKPRSINRFQSDVYFDKGPSRHHTEGVKGMLHRSTFIRLWFTAGGCLSNHFFRLLFLHPINIQTLWTTTSKRYYNTQDDFQTHSCHLVACWALANTAVPASVLTVVARRQRPWRWAVLVVSGTRSPLSKWT